MHTKRRNYSKLIRILVTAKRPNRKQARIVHAQGRELSICLFFAIVNIGGIRILRTRAKAQFHMYKYEQKRYSVS